jgi:alpha(1,3/1,4) fucosyltransferase
MEISPKTIHIIFMPGYKPEELFIKHKQGQLKSFSHYMVEESEKAGFKLSFSKDGSNLQDVAAIISWDVNPLIVKNLVNYPLKKRFLLTFEPPIIAPEHYHPQLKQYFGNIYTMIDDLVDNKTYFKLHCLPQLLERVDPLPDFTDKKLCIMINSNKTSTRLGELYSERRKAIAFFNQTVDFDLYGYGFDGNPSWKGIVIEEAKYHTLKRYKFCLCFENMKNQRGYVSEKIVDCFVGGCVPIYLGATNILDYVPEECFIDFRKFRSYAELYDFMKHMDRTTHEAYLEAGQRFLQSSRVHPFSNEHVVKRILNHVLQVQ